MLAAILLWAMSAPPAVEPSIRIETVARKTQPAVKSDHLTPPRCKAVAKEAPKSSNSPETDKDPPGSGEYGDAYYAGADLGDQIAELVECLSDDELNFGSGARDMWKVIDEQAASKNKDKKPVPALPKAPKQ